MRRGHTKPKREKWAKHRVHCACADALQESLGCIQELVAHISFTWGTSLIEKANTILAKYGSPSRSTVPEKGGAPNTQTSLNPGVNKGRRDSRKPKHTTSGTTNLAGPQISHAWLDNRCARCGHEHEGPCPFCECAEHVEPVDPYDVEVERALEDAARNPSL